MSIMLIAGEASGDSHAAELVTALRAELSSVAPAPTMDLLPLQTGLAPRIFGAGGPRMAAAGVDLRLGDVVCVKDHWCEYGFTYFEGAITVGVIIHCDSLYAGHGPGVRVLFTTRNASSLRVVQDKDANLLRYL